jgi:hypothetical protein
MTFDEASARYATMTEEQQYRIRSAVTNGTPQRVMDAFAEAVDAEANAIAGRMLAEQDLEPHDL